MELSSSGGLDEASLRRRRRLLRIASVMPGSRGLGRDVAACCWPEEKVATDAVCSELGEPLLGLRVIWTSEVSGISPDSLSARSLSPGNLRETTLGSPKNAGG